MMLAWLLGKEERLKWKKLRILLVFLARPDKPITVGALYNATGRWVSLNPILLHLEQVGWLDSEFEAGVGPRRRFYWLTPLGKVEAMRLLEESDGSARRD